jgi:archaellum component FlaC
MNTLDPLDQPINLILNVDTSSIQDAMDQLKAIEDIDPIVKINIQETQNPWQNVLDGALGVISLLQIIYGLWSTFNKNSPIMKMSDSVEKFSTKLKSINFENIDVSPMVSKIKEEIGKLPKYFDDLNENLKTLMNKFYPLMNNLGESIVDGLIQGIKDRSPKILTITRDAFKNVISTTETTFEIASPSKIMQRLGKFISEGLGLGICDGTKYAVKAMDDMGDGVKDASKSVRFRMTLTSFLIK